MAWDKENLRKIISERLSNELFIVVSNREPYIHSFEGEEIVCKVPASGLVIALDPVMRACGGIWVAHGSGDADRKVVDGNDHVAVPPEDPSYALRRVWLSKEEEDGYYYGFSNEALWPLSHIAYTRPVFEESQWQMYKAVNRRFAEAILEEIGRRNAFVFIQDYHFALLSRLIKKPNIRTAQFWHIPWPNPEAFRICPWAEEIIDGLLGNDLLGFHILHHCQNFLATVDRTLEARVDHEKYEVTRQGMATMVKPFPISVDFEGISKHASEPELIAEMQRLTRQHGLRTQLVGIGVDRIDYTKGIVERFKALDRFLEKYPEFQGRFVFVEIGVPSRVYIPSYQRLNDEIDQLIESINRKYRKETRKPIIYIKQHVSPKALRAWYRIANVCIVSSLHDGMNLVAKEFIASRIDEDGILLMSHFTGAARELNDALLINPYAIDHLAQSIYTALNMEKEERMRRMRRLRMQVKEQNIYAWAGKILSTLLQFEFHE